MAVAYRDLVPVAGWMALVAGFCMSSSAGAAEPDKLGPVHYGKTLRYWLDEVHNPAVLAREEAIEVLAHIGPPAREAVPALNALLKDPYQTVRRKAAIALWKIDRRERGAIAASMEALNEP